MPSSHYYDGNGLRHIVELNCSLVRRFRAFSNYEAHTQPSKSTSNGRSWDVLASREFYSARTLMDPHAVRSLKAWQEKLQTGVPESTFFFFSIEDLLETVLYSCCRTFRVLYDSKPSELFHRFRS